MAARKTTTIPPKPVEDLHTVKLPGGHTAKFRKESELTARQTRELSVLMAFMMPKMIAAARARRVLGADGAESKSDVLDGLDVELSFEDTEHIVKISELAVVAYLKSWTIRFDGKVRPLPTTADDLLDLPQPIYNALTKAANDLLFQEKVDEFTVDAVEDPDSPTGGSGD